MTVRALKENAITVSRGVIENDFYGQVMATISLIQPDRLAWVDNVVHQTVENQQRRGVRSDVVTTAGQGRQIEVFSSRTAEELVDASLGLFGRLGLQPRALDEIGCSIIIDDRVNRGIGAEVFAKLAFEIADAGRDAEQDGEMSPGRRAERGDEIAVIPVPVRLGPQETHGRLAIVNLRRERRLMGQAVVDGSQRNAVLGQPRHATVRAVLASPSAAVYRHDQGRTGHVAGYEQVQHQRALRRLRVDDVADGFNMRGACCG